MRHARAKDPGQQSGFNDYVAALVSKDLVAFRLRVDTAFAGVVFAGLVRRVHPGHLLQACYVDSPIRCTRTFSSNVPRPHWHA